MSQQNIEQDSSSSNELMKIFFAAEGAQYEFKKLG